MLPGTISRLAIAACVVFCQGVLAAGTDESAGKHIIGGSTSQAGDYRWMVSVQAEMTRHRQTGLFHLCGGALVADRWVLTAAHCFEELPLDTPIFAWVGGSNLALPAQGMRIEVVDAIVYRDYEDTGRGDIGLLELARPVPGNIDPVRLPSPELSHLLMQPGAMVTVSGWGLVSTASVGQYDDNLRQVQVPIVDENECLASTGTEAELGAFCTGFGPESPAPKGSCQGDSGGPVWIRHQGVDYHLGLVSGGISVCTEPGFYGINTSTPHFLNWIQATIQQNDTFVGPDPVITVAYAGNWFAPDTAGQGLYAEVFDQGDEPQLFILWATYDWVDGGNEAEFGNSRHRWFFAQGGYGRGSAELTLYQTSSGVFDMQKKVNVEPIGRFNIWFDNCTQGRVEYQFDSPELAGAFDISRISASTLTSEICRRQRQRQ